MTVMGGDQFAQQITIALTQAGITITGEIWSRTAGATSNMLKTTGQALKQVTGVGQEPQGKMSLRKLQRTSGGDLHAQEISPELVRRLKRDLTRRGLDFSMENAADGRTYFHFKGADVDSVRHAIAQVAAAIDRHHPEPELTTGQQDAKTTIDPESRFEDDQPAIEDQPGQADIDVDKVLDQPAEWQLDDGIVLGEDSIPEQVTISWINEADLAPRISIEEAIPPSMATYLGRDAQKDVQNLLDEAATRGWSAGQVYQRLNSRPLPPEGELHNPAKLIVSRLDDIAAAPPPPTPATALKDAEQKLNAILNNTSGMDSRQELLTLSTLGNNAKVIDEFGELYQDAFDAHKTRSAAMHTPRSEATSLSAGTVTPEKIRARLDEKIKHKTATHTQPVQAPIKKQEMKR